MHCQKTPNKGIASTVRISNGIFLQRWNWKSPDAAPLSYNNVVSALGDNDHSFEFLVFFGKLAHQISDFSYVLGLETVDVGKLSSFRFVSENNVDAWERCHHVVLESAAQEWRSEIRAKKLCCDWRHASSLST